MPFAELPSQLLWRLRRRPLAWWAMTAALAALTAVTGQAVLADVTAGGGPPGDAVSVPVATRDLPAGAVVDEGDVEWRRLPRRAVPEAPAASDPIGSPVRVALVRGEVVLAARLGRAGASPVAALLLPGTRGISVPATGGALPPLEVGDVVDVVATFESAEPGAAGEDPAFAVARAATVVHVGPEAVTVAVAVAEAPRVAFALARGAVLLALVAVE